MENEQMQMPKMDKIKTPPIDIKTCKFQTWIIDAHYIHLYHPSCDALMTHFPEIFLSLTGMGGPPLAPIELRLSLLNSAE